MAMITAVLESFRFTDSIMNLVISDITNEHALQRSRGGDGASISWIIGHLIDYRHQTMNLFGAKRTREYQEIFGDARAGDGTGYPDIRALLEKWQQLSSEMVETLQIVTDAQLTAKIDGGQTVHAEKTALEVLVFYMWHESYHMGSLGMIRKALGYPATADRAIEASKSQA